MVFIWGDRGYPAVRFEYKTASEQYLVHEIYAKQFWAFSKKFRISIFSKNTQNYFAYNSPTKYCWDAVSLKTNGTISSITSCKFLCCSFFYELSKSNKSIVFRKISEQHPCSGVWCAPQIVLKNLNWLFVLKRLNYEEEEHVKRIRK